MLPPVGCVQWSPDHSVDAHRDEKVTTSWSRSRRNRARTMRRTASKAPASRGSGSFRRWHMRCSKTHRRRRRPTNLERLEMREPDVSIVRAADVRRSLTKAGDIRAEVAFQNDINALLARFDEVRV